MPKNSLKFHLNTLGFFRIHPEPNIFAFPNDNSCMKTMSKLHNLQSSHWGCGGHGIPGDKTIGLFDKLEQNQIFFSREHLTGHGGVGAGCSPIFLQHLYTLKVSTSSHHILKVSTSYPQTILAYCWYSLFTTGKHIVCFCSVQHPSQHFLTPQYS